jgi:hypothetical protein
VLTRNELSLRLNLNAAHERLRELTTPETPKEELSDCSVWTHFKSNATVRQPARTTFAMLSLSLSEAQIAEAKLFPPGRQVRPNPGQFTARERCRSLETCALTTGGQRRTSRRPEGNVRSENITSRLSFARKITPMVLKYRREGPSINLSELSAYQSSTKIMARLSNPTHNESALTVSRSIRSRGWTRNQKSIQIPQILSKTRHQIGRGAYVSLVEAQGESTSTSTHLGSFRDNKCTRQHQ